MLIARNRLREIDRAMRRSARALLACSTATALTATALTAASEEPAWLRGRALRPEDESISRKKAGQKGVAGGPCYPGKTECPFSTSCEWDRDTEDGEEFRERICVHKDLVPANGRASVHESHLDPHAIDAT